MQTSGSKQVGLILAILAIVGNLYATDWSKVPDGTFVAQAIAAIEAIPADKRETVTAELVDVLNVGVTLDRVTNEDLPRIIRAACENHRVDAVTVVRDIYPSIKPKARKSVAAALVAAAPADRKHDVAEVICRLDLPAPPPLNQMVTRTIAIPWGKE